VSVAFLLTTLIVVASPGAGVLYTIAEGLARGRRASIVAAFGCTLGIVPHMAAAVVGLAAILYASSLAFQALKVAGVAYLLFMAWHTWREGGALQIARTAPPRTPRQVVASAVLVNVLNPKLSIFFFAFLPQFVSADDPHRLLDMLGFSAVFMGATFAVFVLYGVAAAQVRERILSRPRVLAWLRRTFAAAFVGLGARLALAHR
jgi:threonine/homoserine/homoserine lactone efflux protein